MTKEDIKVLVRQAIMDMANDYDMANEAEGVANVTANVAGFNGPLGTPIRRKLKDVEYFDDEDDK